MKDKILIVEDEFVVANDLSLMLEQAGYHVVGIADSVEEARVFIQNDCPRMVLLDIHLQGHLTGIDLATELREQDIGFVYISANSNQQVLEAAKATEPYGFLVKPFRTKDILVTLEIAHFRMDHSLESKFRQERQVQHILISLAAQHNSREETLQAIGRALQPFIPFDYMSAGNTPTAKSPVDPWGLLRIGFNEYQVMGEKELISPNVKKILATGFDDQSPLLFPCVLSNGHAIQLSFYSRREKVFHADHLAFLQRLHYFIVQAIERTLDACKKDSQLPPLLTSSSPFKDIIGNSHLLLAVLDQINRVAPFDSSVLILGESGTGKERIAHCIHHLSSRKAGPFIKINCASLPPSLIESELFGHEKGAFTGALDKRIGKFEQAHNGTIFLDEIGEMPLDMQVKLLRVLQEKEIERVGGKECIKVNVRVIAATNRNLEREVGEARFRLDLYYRLNVFPVTLPALRERKEDIQLLAQHFAEKYARQFGKSFQSISGQMIKELEAYHWPGNIRELENVMEQSVILHDGQAELTLQRTLCKWTESGPVPLELPSPSTALTAIKKTQLDTERGYIISILKKARGRIRGADGAAALLQLKPTTLEYKMAKLGISKEDIQED